MINLLAVKSHQKKLLEFVVICSSESRYKGKNVYFEIS